MNECPKMLKLKKGAFQISNFIFIETNIILGRFLWRIFLKKNSLIFDEIFLTTWRN